MCRDVENCEGPRALLEFVQGKETARGVPSKSVRSGGEPAPPCEVAHSLAVPPWIRTPTHHHGPGKLLTWTGYLVALISNRCIFSVDNTLDGIDEITENKIKKSCIFHFQTIIHTFISTKGGFTLGVRPLENEGQSILCGM